MEVVNGYACKTCADVELAKKGVDPAHPKDGPNGIYKAQAAEKAAADRGPAVKLDGALARISPSQTVPPTAYVPGAVADLRV